MEKKIMLIIVFMLGMFVSANSAENKQLETPLLEMGEFSAKVTNIINIDGMAVAVLILEDETELLHVKIAINNGEIFRNSEKYSLTMNQDEDPMLCRINPVSINDCLNVVSEIIRVDKQ